MHDQQKGCRRTRCAMRRACRVSWTVTAGATSPWTLKTILCFRLLWRFRFPPVPLSVFSRFGQTSARRSSTDCRVHKMRKMQSLPHAAAVTMRGSPRNRSLPCMPWSALMARSTTTKRLLANVCVHIGRKSAAHAMSPHTILMPMQCFDSWFALLATLFGLRENRL